MSSEFLYIFYFMNILALPVILSGMGHMYVVRRDLLSVLKIPLNAHWFGKNKTLRGALLLPHLVVVSMPVVEGIHYVFYKWLIEGNNASWASSFVGSDLFLQQPLFMFNGSLSHFLLFSLGLGAVYILCELPNSFIKRRLGIKEGEQSRQHRWLSLMADQSDSTVGVLVYYGLTLHLNGWFLVAFYGYALLVNLGVKNCLYVTGIKAKKF